MVQAKVFTIGGNRTLESFKTFFRWCVERGLLERSPAELVRAPSLEVSRDRGLSDEEVRAIWKTTLTYEAPLWADPQAAFADRTQARVGWRHALG